MSDPTGHPIFYTHLLDRVVALRSKYNEIERLTGERFNIFKILGVSSQEVKMHSALLGDLLNPFGTHGCGDTFLKLFLNQLKSNNKLYAQKLDEFITPTAKVSVEYYIPGGISTDKTRGGRIDILISSGYNHIIIENKIYAGDQDNQMIRYKNFNKEAPLFYLTLNGNTPNDISVVDKNNGIKLENYKDFICISYKDDIISWLQFCLKEAADLPLLRETIKQYIFLLKKLTYQTTSQTMRDELIKILACNDDYFEAAFTISNNIESIKNERSKEISSKIAEVIVEKKLPVNISKWHNAFPRLEYYPNGWNNHLIGFTNDNGFMFGIKRVTDKIKTLELESINFDPSWKTTGWWLCYKTIDSSIFNLLGTEPWLKRNENEIVTTIVGQIEYLIEAINRLDKDKLFLM